MIIIMMITIMIKFNQIEIQIQFQNQIHNDSDYVVLVASGKLVIYKRLLINN